MKFSAHIDYEAFSRAFEKFPREASKELRIELKQACKAIQRDAKANHRFKSKSNMLERSIMYDVDQTGLSAEIFLDEGIASYGKYQHDGTRPHVIAPVTKKKLFWVSGGEKKFASRVLHPGIKPDPFLYKAAKRQESLFMARLNGAINRIIKAAGF